MKIGDKCIFVLESEYYGGKLKAHHRYTGVYAGGDRVSYHGAILVPEEIFTIKRPTVKPKAPTTANYKDFSDLCFEVAIRYRDDWMSVISGKRFNEGDWNGLQAGHGCSRQYWDTRHNPMNCHAITSGENYQMSLGNATTIMKYWNYVGRKYGQLVVDSLVNYNHTTTKLSVSYLKEDCRKQYEFLRKTLRDYYARWKFMQQNTDIIIAWRCEKLPKAKADGVLKVLNLIKGE